MEIKIGADCSEVIESLTQIRDLVNQINEAVDKLHNRGVDIQVRISGQDLAQTINRVRYQTK